MNVIRHRQLIQVDECLCGNVRLAGHFVHGISRLHHVKHSKVRLISFMHYDWQCSSEGKDLTDPQLIRRWQLIQADDVVHRDTRLTHHFKHAIPLSDLIGAVAISSQYSIKENPKPRSN